MNRLKRQKRIQILNLLVEGMSMRAASRIVGVSITTVAKLLVDAGKACALYHDRHVRGVRAEHIQCDEIWSFCYCKQKTRERANIAMEGAGDVWTWTALERDTKLIIAYEVGDRSAVTAMEFIANLKPRLANRVQLTTDGLKAYLEAVEGEFGEDIDFAQLVKVYDKDTQQRKRAVIGNPNEALISTSHVERQNLNMRMGMRRFTRLTNAFSKKLENHIYMLSIYFLYYNFVREHLTLETTPAVAAGLANRKRSMGWIVSLADANTPRPNRPRRYRTKNSN